MFSQVFIRSTTCRLNSTLCRRHFAILAILSPFAAKCVFSACLTFGVQSIRNSLGSVQRHPGTVLVQPANGAVHMRDLAPENSQQEIMSQNGIEGLVV